MADGYSDGRPRGELAAAAAAAAVEQQHQQQPQEQQHNQFPAPHSEPTSQQYSYSSMPHEPQGYNPSASIPQSQQMSQSYHPAQTVNQGYQQSTSYPKPSLTSEEVPPVPFKVPDPSYDGQGQAQGQYQPQPQHQYQSGEDEIAPPLPQRHQDHSYDSGSTLSPYDQNLNVGQQGGMMSTEQKPPLPIRHRDHSPFARPNPDQSTTTTTSSGQPPYDPNNYPPPPPTHRLSNKFQAGDDPSDPTHYTRDPHNMVAYLVPFPKPQIKGIDPNAVPTRFLIYTPPPPPLVAPKEGEKEGKLHKVQRKWQEEVRSAKTSTAKLTSWQGAKSRATKAIAWGVNKTTTSNLEFLGRVDGGGGTGSNSSSRPDSPVNDASGTPTTSRSSSPPKKTVGVTDITLVYPPSIGLNDQQMREEFVNTMLRTKSKAQRDSIIATGLLPVGYGIDILATLVWPFGGLGEIDTVWLYSSVRGAKTAHSVTKRLTSSKSSSSSPSTAPGEHGTGADADTGVADLDKDTLKLSFTASDRIEILTRYLDAECHRVDPQKFPEYRNAPTESDVLEAIGWHPSQTGGSERNWEDEQWEMTEVKDDVKSNMHKAAKEWRKFVIAFAKDPEKAMKK